MRKITTILIIALFSKVPAWSQNNTSAYSIIGIGDIENSYFDRSYGMGNSGVSLFSGKAMYHANPASYSRLDDHFFAIEMAGRYKGVTYNSDQISSTGNSSDFQIEKLAMAIKIKPWWGISFGILPFSSSNYSFHAPKDVQGSNASINGYYTGTGGVHKFYLANAFTPFKNFSVGVESAFLSGSLSQTESLPTDNVIGSAITTQRDIYLSKMYYKFGALYNTRISKKWSVSAGATFSNKTTMNADYSLTVTDGSQTIVSDEKYKTGYFTLPIMYTGGISATYNDKWTFATDFTQQQWTDIGYKGLTYQLVNSNRISAGVEYSKKLYYQGLKFEKYYVQAGGFYGGSYLQMYNTQLKTYGATVGLGLNSRRSALSYQFNLEVGQFGTTQKNLLQQNYVQVGVMLSYRDFWFTKVKKYD